MMTVSNYYQNDWNQINQMYSNALRLRTIIDDLIFSTILDKAAVRSDAAAELDRLTRAQKKGGGTTPGGGSSTGNSIENSINNSSEC